MIQTVIISILLYFLATICLLCPKENGTGGFIVNMSVSTFMVYKVFYLDLADFSILISSTFCKSSQTDLGKKFGFALHGETYTLRRYTLTAVELYQCVFAPLSQLVSREKQFFYHRGTVLGV